MINKSKRETKFWYIRFPREHFTKHTGVRQFLFAAITGAICLILISGCATPKIVFTKEETRFKDYKRVYLLSGKDDPRDVIPIAALKLRELGFDVRELKAGEPSEGSQGTGFVISSEGHILTADHVLAKEKNATVWLQGNRIETDVICNDKDKDLALLKPKSTLTAPVEPLRIDYDSPAKMGQEVYTIGFPLSAMLGKSPRLTKGLVSSTVGFKDNADQLQVSVEVQPGNSGGPLLDMNGRVLGVLQSTLNPLAVLQRTGGTLPQNVNFAAKAQLVKTFLDACPVKIPPASKISHAQPFDIVKNSIVQVYSGLISADFITQPKMVCTIYYQYMWDIFYRFRIFQVELFDYDSGQLLLKAGLYRDDMVSTERGAIDRVFEVIKAKLEEQPEPSNKTPGDSDNKASSDKK